MDTLPGNRLRPLDPGAPVSAVPAPNRTTTRPGPGAAVTRTVTDFLVAFLDRIAAGGGPWTSLQEAVAILRGPGADDLRTVVDTGRYVDWEQMLDRRRPR